MTEVANNVESVFPLSPTQEGMLYHTLHTPGSGVYIGQHVIELNNINGTILKQAWKLVTDRHMALRSIYAWEGLSRSVQLVMRHVEPEFYEIDGRGTPLNVQNFCLDDIKNEFELSTQTPSRMSLLQLHNNRFVLVWTRHHLMMDGWSAHIVLAEISRAYAALSNNTAWQPPATPGFSTYIAWLQQQDVDISKNYWRSILGDIPITPGLESLRLVSRGYIGSRRIEHRLTAKNTEQLASTARKNNLTLSTLVHGAWAAVLFSVNESLSLLFGSTASGRPYDLPEHDAIVGNFINTIPVLINANTDTDLSTWLRDLQQQMAESAKHGHTANRDILQAAGIPPATTLFDSIVVFMNYPQSNDADDGLSFKHTRYHEHSHYALAALVIPGDTLQLIIIHDADQINAEKADLLMNMLSLSLAKLGSGLQGSAKHFFNSLRTKQSSLPTTALTVEPIDVVRRFKDIVHRHGNKPAVNQYQRTLSYIEMSNAAHNLACSMRDMRIQPGDRIVINMPRTIEGLVSIWAVLLLGACYVPVAPSTPRARLIALYSRVNARLLVSPEPIPECDCVLVFDDIDVTLKSSVESQKSTQALGAPDKTEKDLITNQVTTTFSVSPVTPMSYMSFSRSTEVFRVTACSYQADTIDTASAAYIIFTSGSTGEPKQVTVSHHNLAYSLAARLQYYGEKPYNYALLSSFAFDSSVAGIFWTAATGGCLTLINEDIMQDPATLMDELSQHGISALLTLPSAYRAILDMASNELREHLELAIVAGDACPDDIRKEHRRCFPNATLINEYGPTEATVWCSAYRVPENFESHQAQHFLPIGKAIPGVTLHILDQLQRPVPQGAIGELHIAGPTVTQPTDAGKLYATGDLVELDASGELNFHGRRDEQLKIRGHRVDPNEIEAALCNHPDVTDCAVVDINKTLLADEIEALNTALNELPAAEALALLAELEA